MYQVPHSHVATVKALAEGLYYHTSSPAEVLADIGEVHLQ